MTASDAIQLSIASALAGAALVVVVLIIWTFIRDARAARDRREHYVTRTPRGI